RRRLRVGRLKIGASTARARPAALDAPNLCGGFGGAAAGRGVAVAVRTPVDGVRSAWRGVAERVAADAAGLPALGVGPGDTVQITHANMLAEWRSLDAASPTRSNGRLISLLPAAHIADRWSSHYGAMVHGHEVTCCADPRRVMELVPEVRPTTFGAVPRIWEKTKAALEAAIEAEPDEQRRAAARWALDVGRRRVRAEQA